MEDLRRFGVPDEALEQMQDEGDDEDTFTLWPENLPAFSLFTAALTQMRINHYTGLPIGLDYSGLEAAARARKVKLTPALFADVQVMELSYVRARRERAEADAR